ncbi:hypothetical protein Adt_32388 [Abeliophyllum distichum]|uniref:Uncharacterized protein n=1 Tax=Abeliophyllum distichum TaxID=126358 RepID=A0ABD1QUI5_9LAMI
MCIRIYIGYVIFKNSQHGAFSSAPSKVEDYQDVDPVEHEDSDESNGPVDVLNCQTGMSQDEMGRATSSEKNPSAGLTQATQATKKKSGPEIILASINNLVCWGRKVEDHRTLSSTDISSIFECIHIVRNLPGIERGIQLYFYAVHMRNQENRALFTDMDTPRKSLGCCSSFFTTFRK